MALVNLIQINDWSGALLADEEFWRRGSRRTLSLDNLQNLLTAEFSDSTGIEAVIGIEGDPSITYEAVLQAQQSLKSFIGKSSASKQDKSIKTLKDIAEIAVSEIEKVIRKRIDCQLNFTYGFTVDDLNRGYFEVEGEKIDIQQETVRKDALKWIKYDEQSSQTKPIFDVEAIIAGIDPVNGFHWYEWSGGLGNIFLGSGLFESIGKGSDAANLAFIDIFRKRDLVQRRQGMSCEEALFALIEALEAASRFNHEVGGYPEMIIINGKTAKHNERFMEFSGHPAKLAQEIVTASVHGYLPKKNSLEFIKALIWGKHDHNDIEEKFFKAVTDRNALEHFLRGYKNSVTLPKGERSR
ncbi:hypothetical protein JW979_04320 [bacterium]|nr:hypothetical protein [candidate division CSSED10-310 bacterium]